MEAPICVDIIDDERTGWVQECPGSIQLEAYVAFTVQAVVDEKINLAESREQFGKTAPARTFYVRPTIGVTVPDCRTDLRSPSSFYWGKIYAPEIACTVSV